jgi:hypothetical protein
VLRSIWPVRKCDLRGQNETQLKPMLNRFNAFFNPWCRLEKLGYDSLKFEHLNSITLLCVVLMTLNASAAKAS